MNCQQKYFHEKHRTDGGTYGSVCATLFALIHFLKNNWRVHVSTAIPNNWATDPRKVWVILLTLHYRSDICQGSVNHCAHPTMVSPFDNPNRWMMINKFRSKDFHLGRSYVGCSAHPKEEMLELTSVTLIWYCLSMRFGFWGDTEGCFVYE